MKSCSIALLLVAEVAAMSLWFVSAAILPDMVREVSFSPIRQAALSSSVQAGFVVGALVSAIFGLADRYDPRRVFAISAIGAAIVNGLFLVASPGSISAIMLRAVTGALLAGVYPVGMKIAVGWGQKDRGFLVGALVGALTLGAAAPHLISLAGGADWRLTVMVSSIASAVAGVLCLGVRLGPHHAVASGFTPRVIIVAWTNRRVRLAYAGYLGHMWELYAMWAWIVAATAASYRSSLTAQSAETFSKITAFTAISAGAVACILAGLIADRVGKANVAIVAMLFSGASALAMALTFGGSIWLTFAIVVVWGITIIPDSAQFSALIADAVPPEQAGSLMTFQTALGFTLTFFSVQITPAIASAFGWPTALSVLAIGPALGIMAMVRLRSIT